MRLPVRHEMAAKLSSILTLSVDGEIFWMQNWIPSGHRQGTRLVRELKRVGINLPGATSMNVSGRPEIADQTEALTFSREHNVPILLHESNPSHKVKGSFPILGMGPHGTILIRQGHFPGDLFRNLLEYETIARPG